MDTLQQSRLKRLILANEFADNNLLVTKTIPNGETLNSQLNVKIGNIQEQDTLLFTGSNGKTAVKKSYREQLILQTAVVGSKLNGYAVFTGNEGMIKVTNITQSGLSRLPEISLLARSKAIADMADANLTALASYKITAQDIENLNTAITAFYEAAPGPRLSVEEIMQIHQKIETLLEEGEDILTKMKAMVGPLQFSDAAYYNGFMNAAKIIHARRSISLKVQVNDQQGTPVKNVRVLLIPQESGSTGIAIKITKTAEKGGCRINVPGGNYILIAVKTGYKRKEISPVSINDNEMTAVTVVLEKETV